MKIQTHILLGFLLFHMTTGSNAASLSQDGLGQALIYPYYTVNNDLNTLISIVNTKNEVKAISVVFLEGDNSQRVLDFNVYLAPYDIWTAALAFSPEGAMLVTPDNSCAPFLAGNGQAFLPFEFQSDPGSDDNEREREGHFEIIEMGVVADQFLAAAATHVGDVPNNCDALEAAWLPGALWDLDPTVGMAAATGGITGSAIIVDVTEGTAVSYRADAIEDFYAAGDFLHVSPAEPLPNLDSAQPKSIVIDSGRAIESEWESGSDAISALYMRNSLMNEYVLGSGINAKTDWVITFPTKKFYVNQEQPRAPFTSLFDGPEGACEVYKVDSYNRETELYGSDVGQVCTPPPQAQVSMCWSTNVMFHYNCEEGNTKEAGPQILGSLNNFYGIRVKPFTAGMSVISFPGSEGLTDLSGNNTYTGYPVTGFAIQKYTNSNAQPGLLAQYATIFSHSYTRTITSN